MGPILRLLGNIFGIFYGLFLFVIGLLSAVLVPLGIITLFVNPGLGLLMLVASSIGAADLGKERDRFKQ